VPRWLMFRGKLDSTWSDRYYRLSRQTATELSSNRSTKAICPLRIFRRASAIPNQAARSISGKVRLRPERGGHSISKVLLWMSAGSQSPSMAHARTTLPPAAEPRRAARSLRRGSIRSLQRIRAERLIAALRRRQSDPLGCSRHRHPCFAKTVLPDDRAGPPDGRHLLETGGARRFAVCSESSWALGGLPLRLGCRLLRCLLRRFLSGDRHQHLLLTGCRLARVFG
jgi:hypothetical protein